MGPAARLAPIGIIPDRENSMNPISMLAWYDWAGNEGLETSLALSQGCSW